jgi:hypothetical protein
MARRGDYVYMDSVKRPRRTVGEIIRGGRKLSSGARLTGAPSIRCTFSRISVTCSGEMGGFKLGRGVYRVW